MASNSIGSAWRSFWHNITTSDRHASYNSPFRTGGGSGGRHSALTSVSVTGDEARSTLTTSEDVGGYSASGSAGTPYSPGFRSIARRQSEDVVSKTPTTAEVQMQTFNDGLPPAPPVKHSWKRIDRWLEDNYEELFDNVSQGCTQNDINELEHLLDCTLPQDVRESLQVHDGQERGGNPTGLVFSSMLLDCEEIVDEWRQWCRVQEQYLKDAESPPPTASLQDENTKPFSDGGESSSTAAPRSNASTSSNWKEELLAKQDSQPSNAIQKAYAHPAWIPLVRDWGGNNIAVDLSPGPAGKWGQIILMGRDYDCKYVVARSWGAFLATMADDMTSRKSYIDEDTGLLKLKEFKGETNPGYLDILRWRADQKYGRKPPRKRPVDMRINPNIPAVASRGSPYTADFDRGQSPQRRPNGKGPASSVVAPKAAVSSPLSRVAEESTSLSKGVSSEIPSSTLTSVSESADPGAADSAAYSNESDALIDTATPRASVAGGPITPGPVTVAISDAPPTGTVPLASPHDTKDKDPAGLVDDMKTVHI